MEGVGEREREERRERGISELGFFWHSSSLPIHLLGFKIIKLFFLRQ